MFSLLYIDFTSLFEWMPCKGIANVAELGGLASLLVATLVIAVLPIYSSVEMRYLGSDFMREFVGGNPRKALVSTIVCGFLFIASVVSTTLAAKLCRRLARSFGVIALVLCASSGAAALVANGALISTVTSDTCDIAAIFMLAAVVSNITDDAILEWKKKHHCTRDPSACILASHSFVTTHCKHVFLANVCLECVAIALIVIGIGSTLYGHLNALDDVEEEEDEPDPEEITDADRALANARRTLASAS